MTGDFRQVPLGALAGRVRLKAELPHNSQTPAESELGEHVVFHAQDDSVRQQAQHLRVRKRVAD
jgi:hypothetical protein